MNVTIRRARARDRFVFNWQPYVIDQRTRKTAKPWVLTVDGVPYLVMEGETVIYQNGSEAIPDLVRMMLRFFQTLQPLHDDRLARRRQKRERDFEETTAWMRRVAEDAP